jgi:Cu/Zn superoxide dismutase
MSKRLLKGASLSLRPPTEEVNNPHGTHLHQVNDCGEDGAAAGGHWASGEIIGDISCDSTSAKHSVTQPTSVWTIGGDPNTDITQHAIMIHNGATGTKIGCGELAVVQ